MISLFVALILMFGALAFSVFKPHILINVAVFFIITATMILIYENEISGSEWLYVGLAMLAGYEVIQMSKIKTKR